MRFWFRPAGDRELDKLHRAVTHLTTLVTQQGNVIMSAISDFSTAMNGFFDKQDIAVADLQGDVKSLSDQIAALQASVGGTISASDQALLDALSARASAITAKLDALDALTPPVAPPGP